MMKFFRKYTKHLLAFFMVLLLIVWLGGDALESFIARDQVRGDYEVAVMYGRKVQNKQTWPSGHNAEHLDALVQFWRRPWIHVLAGMGLAGNQQLLGSLVMQIRQPELTNMEWYMLTEEAARSGFHVPQDAVDSFRNAIPAEMLSSVKRQRRISDAQLDQAIQAFLRVEGYAATAAASVKATEADVRDMVRQTREKVRIKAVVLEAKDFLDPTYEPTPAEQTEHFDKYKNVASRPGETMEFGYQMPETAQVQYIKVAVDPLVRLQRVTDEEAYEYWQARRTEFTRPTTQPVGTQPAEAPRPYETFTEARNQVRERMQRERARREAQRIASEVISLANRPWADAPTTQPGNIKQVPAGQDRPEAYQEVVDRLRERYGEALSIGEIPMSDRQQMSMLPGVGRATALPNSDQQISVAQAAFLVPAIEDNPDVIRQSERFFRNLYETVGEPFIDVDGNAYVIRTIAARPSHAPESIDLVRNKLSEDIRRQRAFEEAQRRAEALAEAARAGGLEEALAANAELQQRLGADALKKPEPFARGRMINYGGLPQLFPAPVPQFGFDPALVEKIFDLQARSTTQPTAIATHEQRAQQRWIVVQHVETLPVTQAEYQEERDMAMNLVRIRRQVELLSAWFSPEGIRERVGWKDLGEKDTPAEESAKASL